MIFFFAWRTYRRHEKQSSVGRGKNWDMKTVFVLTKDDDETHPLRKTFSCNPDKK